MPSNRQPNRTRRAVIWAFLSVFGVTAAATPGFAQMMQAPSGPTEVGVTPMNRGDVPVTVELPGRAVAYQLAAIRPRVGGEITEIPYEAGTEVEPGTLLFTIQDETLAAELTAQDVAVASAQAALAGAEATLTRYRRLSGSGVSLAEVEVAEVELAAAEAQLGAARAQRDLARLALERTQITSPIRGVVAVTPFSVGDIVSTGQSEPLTYVAQIDPIYVDVLQSRALVLRAQRNIAEGILQRPETEPDARLVLETGESYDQPGRMLSPSVQVSATTGTVPIRVRFPNPDRRILPGQFVRVTLTIGSMNAFLVPQRATSRAASGDLTAFVARNGRAEQVLLTEQGTHENAWIVTEGLTEGDALILDGLDDLRDGAEVTTVPVTIDADGVVREIGDMAAEASDEEASAQADGDPAELAEGSAAPPAPANGAAQTGG
ncbi:efflux RND transporter periplasmic adaptor subunit [Paracoccus aerodenitrificans]|uniref:efflux RND transporter periplasmic adaptor subunit n=1 Tax=Paracoccus aerodenitrificans TaxID=3017781 RepID=UPI0022F00B5B|nr:efflux RND transporter periplasmic adaptor subunit [Paracoccus aerodenitrificans]WBU65303.1 efflux RND transporter periplasmic adaptor subunit [Paracoccus aerodenitrificans]